MSYYNIPRVVSVLSTKFTAAPIFLKYIFIHYLIECIRFQNIICTLYAYFKQQTSFVYKHTFQLLLFYVI
jgi:hypothetical protein